MLFIHKENMSYHNTSQMSTLRAARRSKSTLRRWSTVTLMPPSNVARVALSATLWHLSISWKSLRERVSIVSMGRRGWLDGRARARMRVRRVYTCVRACVRLRVSAPGVRACQNIPSRVFPTRSTCQVHRGLTQGCTARTGGLDHMKLASR